MLVINRSRESSTLFACEKVVKLMSVKVGIYIIMLYYILEKLINEDSIWIYKPVELKFL